MANRNHNRQGINTWIGVRRAIALLLGPAYGGVDYVDRILLGEQPSDLPVQLSTKSKMVVNVKTAKALGLTVPQSTDEVIEQKFSQRKNN